MKLLVTGGAGFIGANYLHWLHKNHPEDQIVCIDALTYAGNMETLAELMDQRHFRFVHGSISDRDFIMDLFSKEHFDAVVNFAAETHVDRSFDHSDVFISTNIQGTHILLEACRSHGMIRFHQVSTDEVYGDLPLDRPDLLFTENTPIHASSPYSASKASADLLVMAYHRTFNMPISISRCSNNYGPYQFPEKLIPLVITRALADMTLPIYGTGENIRDWLFVEDHCSAVDSILRFGKLGEVYNIGGNNEQTNLSVVRTILAELGKPETLIRYVPDRLGHDRRYAIDPTKIMRDLGWRPVTNFSEGIHLTVQWYQTNRSWWENIVNGEYRHYFDTMYKDRYQFK